MSPLHRLLGLLAAALVVAAGCASDADHPRSEEECIAAGGAWSEWLQPFLIGKTVVLMPQHDCDGYLRGDR
jgi:hypothetical protein